MKPYERFLKYIAFDTMSDPNCETYPSSKGQLVLARYLVDELKSLGIENARLSDTGVVYAKLNANTNKPYKKIGVIAHLDTSPDMPGKDVSPRIIKSYDGGRITLNDSFYMDANMFPVLERKKGHDLIVTDGTTLLGADNKAGVAIIMSFIERIISENIEHGDIAISFTPDEEIGKGTDNFELDTFDCDFAYTIDGGDVSVIEYENFNAATAKVYINGTSIHPGYAKNKMKNAILLGMEFNNLLPTFLNPAFTEKYEGFNHITEFKGECEKAYMEYIIRNHDEDLFNKQKEYFIKTAEFLNYKHGDNVFNVQIKDSYYNMRKIIEKDMTVVNIAIGAMKEIGLTPEVEPIRGGTDGARLTYNGLPCPNIGTGGYNFHGKYEFLSIDEMNKSVELLVKIMQKTIQY